MEALDAEIADLASRLADVLNSNERGLSSWHDARAQLGRKLHDRLTAALR